MGFGIHFSKLIEVNAMNLARRQFLHLAAGAAAPMICRTARALAYPTRPVRLMVGFAPGGGTDILARLLGQWLSERLGQPFIVENRTGANGNIATEAVVRAQGDGYTLLVTNASNLINPTLYERLSFNFIRDVAPVAGLMRVPNVLDVNPSLAARTIPEFIAYAKANPGKISMASAGSGSPSHMAGELFKLMAGVDMLHVPYRGAAPAIADVIGGQVNLTFSDMPSAIEYIRAGKLRALGVTTAARSEALADIPPISEFVPGYEASQLFGLVAPGSTSTDIVAMLNHEINAGLADPKLKARLADLGGRTLAGPPAEFGNLIAEEIEKWGKVIRAANIKPD